MMGRGRTYQSSWSRLAVAVALALAVAGSISCGNTNGSTGRSPSYLYIESLTAASGATPDSFGNVLQSDVVTNIKVTVGTQEMLQPTVFEDIGRAVLRMGLKDVGAPNFPTGPTFANSITVNRYHVEYRRSDGRNTPGVDVPYAFDGAATGTFDSPGAALTFSVVRAQAKLESPLKALRNGGGSILISTIAEITFYGKDQNGNDVTVTGSMSVTFADWGDPV
jgi:hypothetical protein